MSIINGTEMMDFLGGTAEDDVIRGFAGNDRMNGFAGTDTLDGGAGNDSITGSEGDDFFIGGAGNDTMDGGAGFDSVSYEFSESSFVSVFLSGFGQAFLEDDEEDRLFSVERVTGTNGNDNLFGGEADETLIGLDGDDNFNGGGGDDSLVGGDGFDRAAYDEPFGTYILSIDGGSAGAITVADKRAEGEGTDTLGGVETLQFEPLEDDSFTLDLRTITGAAGLAEDDLKQIVELYIAYLDRVPDALGLLYWGTRLAEGMTLGEIATSFWEQGETREIYAEILDDPEALVAGVYDNLLEREPDEEGAAYWVAALENGDVRLPEFILAVINGAKAETGSPGDARTIAEKAEIGYAYAIEAGLTNVENAGTALDEYDIDDAAASIAAAQDAIESFRTAAEDSMEVIVEVVGLGVDPLLL